MNRREFLASLGGAGLFFAIRFTSRADTNDNDQVVSHIKTTDIDYTEWIVFGPDDSVSVFTGRTELGQGLKTVITALVTQGLDISQEKLTVVQGDTDCCPDDGPTVGSAATKLVGWGFWLACEKIRGNLVSRASRRFGIPVGKLEFRSGGVGLKGESHNLASAYELGEGETVKLSIDPKAASTGKQYVDLGIQNVNAEQIVTGGLTYVGDVKTPGMLYAGLKVQAYHPRLTRLLSEKVDAAQKVPGVKLVEAVDGRVAVVGERYSDVLKALDLVETRYSVPARPKEIRLEEEVRAEAKLLMVKEERGDVDAGLAASDLVISETYTTRNVAHAQIETDVSTALPADAEGRVTVWVGSQYPHLNRRYVANRLNKSESDVHVIAVPVGGAFGGKIASPVHMQAAVLAQRVGAPVKLIYSRKDQFQMLSQFKAAVVIDITTGVSADGKILARKMDIFQDEGEGTDYTYAIPNVRTRLYETEWFLGHAAWRGTSFVQDCFAIESHVDMVAHRLGLDPLEFRRRNVYYTAYIPLLDDCARAINYDNPNLSADEGIGWAIVRHGGAQLGVVAARVHVDRVSGIVTVKQVCAAFDVGPIINHRTATACVRGGIAWGIGYALKEEVKLNGHSVETEFLSEYKIPRFSDMPRISINFFDNHHPGSVRGCGELPVIPTVGAIVNAVYNAIGVRFYSTPITPERVREALGTGV
jgi:isoquinoline 1-oxidoreductase